MRGRAPMMKSKAAKAYKHYEFVTKRRGMENRLTYLDGYCIDSVYKGVTYAADNEQFVIIRSEGFLVCKIEEMPALAEKLIPCIKQEVLGIYEDLKDLIKMEIVL